jgi:hypothetical protein
MRELFLQIVYGRTQSAFSDDGLAVGAGLEDLGKGLRSQVGTMYATKFWESTGKEYILGIDGRKFHVRSAHSIVNLLFQSAGSLSMKYGVILSSQMLEEQNYLGNLLEDSKEESENKNLIFVDNLNFSIYICNHRLGI